MTREIIKIVDCVNKISQGTNKPYVTVNGNMNVFEPNLIATLQNGINKTFEMEVVEANGYVNIRKIYGEVNEVPGQVVQAQAPAMPQVQMPAPIIAAPRMEAQAQAPKVRAPVAKVEMLVSYAKDLMVSGMVEGQAISAIKNAYLEFLNL